MGQHERLYRLKRLLDGGRCVPKDRLLKELEVSPATLKRDIAYLRDRMNAPIEWDRHGRGWRLSPAHRVQGEQIELPGMWFSADEVHALLTMQHLLSHLDAGGLLGPHIEPLMARLNGLLATGAPTRAELSRRIKIQTVGARRVHLPHFQAVGTALLRRQRLWLDYHGRGRDTVAAREVSPQRLVHYRDNWYLDAWCHLRRALRSFAVDAIVAARTVDRPAVEVTEAELNAVLGAGYGIFSGQAVSWATLRFAPERARWVSAETWHARQRGRWDADGSWLLELPYADPRELAMDILRHVPHVEVVAPEALRADIINMLHAGLARLTP